ncbi:hypothetical protein BGZ58_008811 [Dissophora ornata]|nr:hypothetical protein BGZ58_008811 [Dissophora ornata]
MAAMTGGPPHYNILVLGSDSAPLASTLYKMSGLLPGTTKIRHYQEISGFFVAYFRSSNSFSCTPKVSTEVEEPSKQQHKQEVVKRDAAGLKISQDGADEVKSRRQSSQEFEDDEQDRGFWGRSSIETATGDDVVSVGRSSEETLLQLKPSFTQSTFAGSSCGSSGDSTANSFKDTEECEEVLLSDTEKEDTEDDISQETKATSLDRRSMPKENREPCTHAKDALQSQTAATTASVGLAESEESELTTTEEEEDINLNTSANASLSIHAFSLDTTWPVPRILAQTFWFPFAHGIIYVVDATRKNDPRGVDHLLNARQFLASLVADPHFRRRDIPVVVFANKAGMDPETCYRLDEIAEILGCEDWDMNGNGGVEMDTKTGGMRTRPWCVKSTRSDGEGEGIRESVAWLKSRMGEIWMP